MKPNKKRKHHKLQVSLFFLSFIIMNVSFGQSQILLNGDFELGSNKMCDCATGYTCENDAGRVVDTIHQIYSTGGFGCLVYKTNFKCALGAHSGSGSIFFYAGSDQITSGQYHFEEIQKLNLCVWYAGPQGEGSSGQNTDRAFFSFGIDGIRLGSHVLVPVGTKWTQHCFSFTVTPGNYNFSIMSGDAAEYTIWLDDFSIEKSDLPPDTTTVLEPSNGDLLSLEILKPVDIFVDSMLNLIIVNNLVQSTRYYITDAYGQFFVQGTVGPTKNIIDIDFMRKGKYIIAVEDKNYTIKKFRKM